MPLSKKEAPEKPRHLFSLGVKWTSIVGIGIFATFLVFSMVLFTATKQVLISQEKSTISDTLNAVEQRLSPVASNLTIASVVPRIEGSSSDAAPSDSKKGSVAMSGERGSIFSDSVTQKISRPDISLAIYNTKGEVQFSSRSADQPLKKVGESHIALVSVKGFDGLVGRAPITSSVSGSLIGYVQVTDSMQDFHAAMNKVSMILVSLAITALVVAMLIGAFLAWRFLKPIHLITDTISVVNEEPQSSIRIPELHRHDELGDLVNDFNGMLDRIQRFIDQQGEFVQDVSHELRTPVAILEGHLQLLNRWGKDDPEVLDESLKASLQEVTRMKSLIQEMLDLTRADQVDVQFPNAVSDVDQTVSQVVNDMQMIHPDFTFNLDNDLGGSTYIRMYRNHLEQVLIILMDNAVKYSQKRKEVHVSASKNSDGVALAVQDFGEGISSADKERVFNRFYRVDKARSREKGGNGLGLSIAQQLVESYHGTIQVDSVLGNGSIFRVDLPEISKAEADRLREQEEQHQAQSSPPDDDLHSQL